MTATLVVAWACFLGACRAPPPQLERLSLAEPGWSARHGQAVWQRRPGDPDLAGDLIVARSSDGRSFVEFAKPPLVLVVARVTGTQWQIEFPSANRRLGGSGRPPDRWLWLQLPGALAQGATPSGGWSLEERPDGSWRMHHARSGESLEGFLSP